MCQEGPQQKRLEVCVVCGKLKERHDVILAKDKELRADKEDFTGGKNEFGQCRTDSRVSLQADEALSDSTDTMGNTEIPALSIGVRPPSFDRNKELNEVQFRVNGVQSSSSCTSTDVARVRRRRKLNMHAAVFHTNRRRGERIPFANLHNTFTFCVFESAFLLSQKTLSHGSVTPSTGRHRWPLY